MLLRRLLDAWAAQLQAPGAGLRPRVAITALIVLSGLVGAPALAADPPAITISGNHFVAGGVPLRLIGVDRSGSEYACTGPLAGGGEGYGVFVGPTDQTSVDAMLSWDVNAVMLPLNEACWLGNYQDDTTGQYAQLNPKYTGTPYQQAVESYVSLLNANGIYVVLDLLGAGPGTDVYAAPGPRTSSSEIPMADADHSLDFWASVATAFRSDGDVLFHVYDEPNSDVTWPCLLDGCTVDDEPDGAGSGFGSYTAVGDQALVDAIRDVGATQPILLSGIDYAGDLSQWQSYLPDDPDGQLAAVIDTFDFTGNFGAYAPDDQSQNMISVASHYPLLIGGFGESDCSTASFANGLMDFADEHGISYMAWTWDTEQDYGGCDNNALLDDGTNGYDSGYETGDPSGYGAGIRAHFLQLAADSSTTTTSTTTTSTTSTSTSLTETTTATTTGGGTSATQTTTATTTGAGTGGPSGTGTTTTSSITGSASSGAADGGGVTSGSGSTTATQSSSSSTSSAAGGGVSAESSTTATVTSTAAATAISRVGTPVLAPAYASRDASAAPAPASGHLELTSSRARALAEDRSAWLAVRCAGTVACRGSYRLSVLARFTPGGLRRVGVAAGSYVVHGGASARLTVTIQAAGRALLRSGGARVPAVLSVSPRGARVFDQDLTLVPDTSRS